MRRLPGPAFYVGPNKMVLPSVLPRALLPRNVHEYRLLGERTRKSGTDRHRCAVNRQRLRRVESPGAEWRLLWRRVSRGARIGDNLRATRAKPVREVGVVQKYC